MQCQVPNCPMAKVRECFHEELEPDQICRLCSMHDTIGTVWVDDGLCLYCQWKNGVEDHK